MTPPRSVLKAWQALQLAQQAREEIDRHVELIDTTSTKVGTAPTSVDSRGVMVQAASAV